MRGAGLVGGVPKGMPPDEVEELLRDRARRDFELLLDAGRPAGDGDRRPGLATAPLLQDADERAQVSLGWLPGEGGRLAGLWRGDLRSGLAGWLSRAEQLLQLSLPALELGDWAVLLSAWSGMAFRRMTPEALALHGRDALEDWAIWHRAQALDAWGADALALSRAVTEWPLSGRVAVVEVLDRLTRLRALGFCGDGWAGHGERLAWLGVVSEARAREWREAEAGEARRAAYARWAASYRAQENG